MGVEPRTPVALTTARRASLVVAVVVLLAGCGNVSPGASSTTPSAESATTPSSGPPESSTGDQSPDGIASVDWPTMGAQLRALVDAMPASLDGGTRGPLEVTPQVSGAPQPVSYNVSYRGVGMRRPTVMVSQGDAGQSAAFSMLGLWAWAGGSTGCVNWHSSPSLEVLPQASSGAETMTQIAAIRPPATEFLWYSCTSVVNVDGGPETLPPDEQEHILVWSHDGWVFSVASPTNEQTSTLTKLLEAAVTTG